MVEILHKATDQDGGVTYIVELHNDSQAGVGTTVWLLPTCERLRESGSELFSEVSGHRYLLCDHCI